MNLSQPGKTPGKQPKWSFNEKTGKLVRKGKGGIDWYRYRKKVLEPLFIPFCKEHNLILQQDGASPHIHHLNKDLVEREVETLNWPGNSPDFNMSEPAWPWMKQHVQTLPNWDVLKHLVANIKQCWEDLTQEQI